MEDISLKVISAVTFCRRNNFFLSWNFLLQEETNQYCNKCWMDGYMDGWMNGLMDNIVLQFMIKTDESLISNGMKIWHSPTIV